MSSPPGFLLWTPRATSQMCCSHPIGRRSCRRLGGSDGEQPGRDVGARAQHRREGRYSVAGYVRAHASQISAAPIDNPSFVCQTPSGPWCRQGACPGRFAFISFLCPASFSHVSQLKRWAVPGSTLVCLIRDVRYAPGVCPMCASAGCTLGACPLCPSWTGGVCPRSVPGVPHLER